MKEYHHGNLKEQLLKEGLKLLTEEGYANFSMRKLSRRCKVSHTSPYRHFSDKEELIRTLAREIQDKFNKALKEGLDSVTGSSVDKVKAMGRAYVHFFLKNPDFLDLLFLTPELQNITTGKHEHPNGSSFETYLNAILAMGEASGEAIRIPHDPASPEQMNSIPGSALQPWCLIHGLTVLLVKKALPVTSNEAVDLLIDQVLNKSYF